MVEILYFLFNLQTLGVGHHRSYAEPNIQWISNNHCPQRPAGFGTFTFTFIFFKP